MHTPHINQDDALGDANDYDDQQGVFSQSRGAATRPAVEPESSGGGVAKILLLVFVSLLVCCVGWVAWKLASRGGGGAEDTLSLPTTESSAMPMSGAPVDEAPIGPSAATQVAIAPQQVPVTPVHASAPAGAQELTSRPDSSAANPLSAAATPVVEANHASGANVPHPVTAPNVQPNDGTTVDTTARAASDGSASERQLSQELEATKRRLSDLERRVGVLQSQAAISPNDARASAATPRRAAPARRAPAPVVASEPRRATPSLASTGITLKAVLEGRAWLQLKSGETVTVAPGDNVAGMGAVRSIDAERGEVRFTNGQVLQ